LEYTSQPDISGKPSQTLEALAVLFSKQFFLKKRFTFTLRPLQLTVEKNDIDNWQWLRNFIKEKVEIHRYSDIQLLESSHSIDIILRPQVSKLNILQHCLNICERKGLATNIVCIGDKGRYPGNDYELLATEYSLSVDEVSSDPDTCWNLSELGYKGKLSCLTYLNSAKFTESHFTLSL